MTDQSTIQCMLLFAKHAQSNSKNNWAADEFCYKLTIKTSRKEVGKIYGRLFVMAPNNSVWFLYKEHYIDFTNSSSVIVSKHVFNWNISKTKNWTRKCGFISNIAGESQSLLSFLEPSTMALAYSFLPLLPLLCLFCFIM